MSVDLVTEVVTGLYAAYGDRARFDAHLDPAVTVWESDCDHLLRGLSELDGLRDGRTPDGGPDRDVRLSVSMEQVEAWEGTGLARYLLHGRYADGGRPDVVFRVTDVLRCDEGRWRIVHHHSEQVTAVGSGHG